MIVAKALPSLETIVDKIPSDGLVIDLVGHNGVRDTVQGKCAYEGIAW